MDILSDFNAEKFYLGTLCGRQHNYQETGQSLRYNRKRNRHCIECARQCGSQRRKDGKDRSKEDSYLGTLCIRGHSFQGTGQSLRYKSHGCVECRKVINNKPENIESHRECDRKYRSTAEGKEKSRLRTAKWRKNNAEALLEKYAANIEEHRRYNTNYYLANKDRLNLLRRTAYKKTEAGRASSRKRSILRRARLRNVHSVDYTSEQLLKRFLELDNRCGYCGSNKKISADHFLPISRGGTNCLGNIVGACLSCNSSKRDSDPYEWYQKQSFYSKRRWNLILKVLGKTMANYNQIPLL